MDKYTTFAYDICPVPKPRQTQADKWQKRPAVLRYRAFADECRLKKVVVPPTGAWVLFSMPVPKRIAEADKQARLGQPHRQRPDIDNLLKALLDALYHDDSGVSDIRATKVWAENGSITVYVPTNRDLP